MRLNFWPYVIINIVSRLPQALLKGTVESQYVGCFSLNDLKHKNVFVLNDDCTNSYCIERCTSGTIVRYIGRRGYAATYRGDQCICTNTDVYGLNKKHDTECSTTCKGNSKEKCGKHWELASVYRVCPEGKFGRGCSEDCHCGENVMCHPLNGTCSGNKKTCQNGWWNWPECQSSCSDSSCTRKCHCLAGVPCNNNGECSDIKGRRCVLGYAPKGFPKCDIKCDPGTYGEDCKDCPLCRHRGCDPTHGTCESCLAGYKGTKCQEYCEAGYYDFDCKKKCKGHCANNAPCSPVDGSCPEGCKGGYEGKRCEIRSKFSVQKPKLPEDRPNPSNANTIKDEITVLFIASWFIFLEDFLV